MSRSEGAEPLFDDRIATLARSLENDGRTLAASEARRLGAAVSAVVRAFTAEAEDWNDGEYALWRKDDLVNALVELRQVTG